MNFQPQQQNWTQNKTGTKAPFSFQQNSSNVFSSQSKSTTGGFGTAFQKPQTDKTLPLDEPIETVNDLSISKNDFVAAATWSGLRVWSMKPKNTETPTTTPGTFTFSKPATQTPAIDPQILPTNILEPSTRCVFKSNASNILYVGNIYGKITIFDTNTTDSDYFGHHKQMITGLRYNRNREVVVSASTDGICCLWDAKNRSGCIQIDTKINCTNLATSDYTVGICGIDLESPSPVVKLYDIRSCGFVRIQNTSMSRYNDTLSKPFLTYPAKASTFPTASTTSAPNPFTQQPKTNTNPSSSPANNATTPSAPPATGTFGFGPTKSTMTNTFGQNKNASAFPDLDQKEINKLISQFSCIELDKTGKNFIAGSLGGILVASYDSSSFEEYYCKPTPGKAPKQAVEEFETFPINSLALVPKNISHQSLTQNLVYAGLANGAIASFTTFRKQARHVTSTSTAVISNFAVTKPEGQAITACAVSPNSDLIVVAYGNDYTMGSNESRPAQILYRPIAESELKNMK